MYVSQPPTTHKSNCYTSALKGHGMTTPCRSTERPLVVPNSCLRPKLSSHSLMAISTRSNPKQTYSILEAELRHCPRFPKLATPSADTRSSREAIMSCSKLSLVPYRSKPCPNPIRKDSRPRRKRDRERERERAVERRSHFEHW